MTHIFYLSSLFFLVLATGQFFLYTIKKKIEFFRNATLLTLLSFVLLSVMLLLRGKEFGWNPASLVYGRFNLIAWFILAVYFFAEYKFRIRSIGTYLLPIAAILMIISLFDTNPPVNNNHEHMLALNIHIALVLCSFSLFFLSFSLAIIYILKTRALKSHKSEAINDELPSLTSLKRMLVKTFNASWLLLTLGTIMVFFFAKGGNAEPDIKALFGGFIWVCFSILFTLYKIKKLRTRNLARAITFLFLLIFTFSAFVSLKNLSSSESIPAHSPVKQEVPNESGS